MVSSPPNPPSPCPVPRISAETLPTLCLWPCLERLVSPGAAKPCANLPRLPFSPFKSHAASRPHNPRVFIRPEFLALDRKEQADELIRETANSLSSCGNCTEPGIARVCSALAGFWISQEGSIWELAPSLLAIPACVCSCFREVHRNIQDRTCLSRGPACPGKAGCSCAFVS